MLRSPEVQDLQKQLAAPFKPNEIEWRVQRTYQSNGKTFAWVVAYVQSRAIMNRLDSVLGVDGWETELKELKNGFMCGIRLWFSEQHSVIKWDGSDNTSYEATKGGISGSLKRAAVHVGIGRYLYNLSEMRVELKSSGQNYYKDKQTKKVYYWDNPQLPGWALPEGYSYEKKPYNGATQSNNQQNQGNHNGNNKSAKSEVLVLVKRFEKQIGLDQLADGKEKIVRIFNKANNTKFANITDVYQKSSIEQLQSYCKVLKPVRDVCMNAITCKCSVEEMLHYAQIKKPERKIDSIYSLFFILSDQDVKQINELTAQSSRQKRSA